jgi:hypothetical protein
VKPTSQFVCAGALLFEPPTFVSIAAVRKSTLLIRSASNIYGHVAEAVQTRSPILAILAAAAMLTNQIAFRRLILKPSAVYSCFIQGDNGGTTISIGRQIALRSSD